MVKEGWRNEDGFSHAKPFFDCQLLMVFSHRNKGKLFCFQKSGGGIALICSTTLFKGPLTCFGPLIRQYLYAVLPY